MMAAATRVSDRILTVSEYSKSDLCRYLAVKPEKITVSYPAPDENFGIVQDQDRLRQMKEKLNVPDEYILYTGIYRERKNHAALLRALALLLDSGVQIHLVIAGGLGEGEHKIRALAGELGITKNVILTGFVPDQEMPSLYSAARAYVCPSLYEGFGLTLVEAMACGVPVVSHNETSLPEICGQAALCVNARDPGELAQAIRKVLEDQDLRENLIKLGYENISRFSYRVAARDALQIYRALASTKAKGERRQVPLED
jgi:glycosyltransferase involved in cell wall biosynthesis